MTCDRLQRLGPETWPSLVSSPAAVLVLTRSDCQACARWSTELEAFLASERRWQELPFGKLVLDQPGLGAFKRASPWLREVAELPFNAIYVDGVLAGSFLGAGVPRLVARLERLVPG